VNLLFFGMARDLTGVAEEHLEIPDGQRLGDLWGRCEARFPRLGEIAGSLVTAVNQEIADRGRIPPLDYMSTLSRNNWQKWSGSRH
jgi:molybdopterin converting factor small subunit